MVTLQELSEMARTPDDQGAQQRTQPSPRPKTNVITGKPDVSEQEALEQRRQKFIRETKFETVEEARQPNILLDVGQTFFKEGIPKLIKGMILGVPKSGIGEAEALAKMTEEAGYKEEAEAIRRGERVQRIMDMSNDEIIDKVDPPSFTRAVSTGLAEYAPASIMALRRGRVDPKLFSSFGLKGTIKRKVAQEVQSDVIPSVLLEIMDRDPNAPIMDQIERGGKNLPLSLATVGILSGAGQGAKRIVDRAGGPIKDTFKRIRGKLDAGEAVDAFDREMYLQDEKLKRIFRQTRDVTEEIAVVDDQPLIGRQQARSFLSDIPESMEGVDEDLFLSAARMLLKKPSGKNKTFAQKVSGGVRRFIQKTNDNFVDRFAPLGRAEKSIYKKRGLERPFVSLSERFQLFSGSEGKAIADTMEFEKGIVEHILDPASTKQYDGFNEYLLLKRIKDRVMSDPERKKIVQRVESDDGILKFEWNENASDAGLRALRKEVGDEMFTKYELLAQKYQQFMNRSLQIQVEAGKISQEMADTIRSGNEFYAPFRVLKGLDEIEADIDKGIMGNKSISTTEQLAKKIKGISGEEDFFIDDIVSTSYDNIYKGRLLAEKNKKMQQLLEVARLDKENNFFQILDEDKLTKVLNKGSIGDGAEKAVGDVLPGRRTKAKEPPRGWKNVHAFVDGEQIRIAVHPDIAKSIQGMGRGQMHVFSSVLRAFSLPFKAGATGFNIGFQLTNFFFADPIRQAVLSRHGMDKNIGRFAIDYIRGFSAAVNGNFKQSDELALAYLRSDAFNSVVQRNLTPNAFREITPPKSVLQKYGRRFNPLTSIPKIGAALEQTGKITGFLRGSREVNAKFGVKGNSIDESLLRSNRQYRDAVEEMLIEVRNFGGSPDFFRGGHLSPDLNLLFMFMNARVQGTVADIGRLVGAKGRGTSDAWRRLAIAKMPGTINYLRNKMYYSQDLDDTQEWERENYHIIYSPDSSFINDDSQLIRDAFKIPKREIEKLTANVVEGFIDFLWDRDPAKMGEVALQLLEEVSPLNLELTGNRAGFERSGQQVIAQSNPLLRVPVETFFGVNTFTGNPILSQRLQRVEPWMQYKDSTPEIYKYIAMKLKDSGIAPEVLQSPERLRTLVDGMLGGGAKQLQTFDVPEDRSGITGLMAKYGVLRRFVRSEYKNENDIQKDLADFKRKTNTKSYQRDLWAENEKLKFDKADSEAEKVRIVEGWEAELKNKGIEGKRRYDALERVFELDSLGISFTDRLALSAKAGSIEDGEFARLIYGTILPKYTTDGNHRRKFLEAWYAKGVINDTVREQLQLLFKKFGPPSFRNK